MFRNGLIHPYFLPFELALKMFDSQILSILEYGSEIWYQGKQCGQLESVHLTYLKNTLGVGVHTCTQAVYAETGRLPLEVRQKLSMINYWHRIILGGSGGMSPPPRIKNKN